MEEQKALQNQYLQGFPNDKKESCILKMAHVCHTIKELSFLVKGKTLTNSMFVRVLSSVPGAIRTPDRRLRRPLLYPAELLGHNWSG